MNAEEYRTWLKKRRKKRIRLLAAALCFCVLCTTYPNILETFSVIASAETETQTDTETKTEITDAEATQTPELAQTPEPTQTPEPEQPTRAPEPTQTSEAQEQATQTSEPTQPQTPEQPPETEQAPEPTQPPASEQPPATEEQPESERPTATEEQPPESEEPPTTSEEPSESEHPSETETLTEETETLTEETETETDPGDTQEEDLRALTELLTALPDPETYLTYDKAADCISEHEDLIDEAQITKARQALDAYTTKYTDKYTTKNPTTPNTDTPAEPASFPALIARLEGLEHLRDTSKGCYDFDCPYHYPWFLKERMNQNETPALLTLEDLIEDYGVEPPAAADGRRKARAAAPVSHPQTLMVTTDNENNAHTGSADGDLDTPMSHYKIYADGNLIVYSKKNPLHPIEASFTLDELPTQSAYVAIKTFDVHHFKNYPNYVYVNDDIYKPMDLTDEDRNEYNNENIGCLVGASYTWSVTVLEIPREKLVKGKNVISIYAPEFQILIADWMQLILDGGAADTNLENFSLTLKESAIEGKNAVFYADANVRQKGDTQYATEYTLIQEETGLAQAVRFGNISEKETAMLTMPLDSPSGTYRITGVLKDAATEKIMATDSVSFYFLKNVGIGVKTSHTLTPDTFTNRSVTIRVSAEATDRKSVV